MISPSSTRPLLFRYPGSQTLGSQVDLQDVQGCLQSAWGPEQDARLMRLQPVYEHDKLGKDDLWATIRSRVRDVPEVQRSAD